MKNIIILLLLANSAIAQRYLNDSVWWDTTYTPGAAYGADIGRWDPATHPYFMEKRQDWQRLSGYNEGDTTPWGIQHYSIKIDSADQRIITWGNPNITYEGDWVLSEDCLCAWNAWPSDSSAKIKYRFYGDNIKMYGQRLPHLGRFIFEIDGEPWMVDQCCGDDSVFLNVDFKLDLDYHDVIIQPIDGHIVFKWFIINFKEWTPPGETPAEPVKMPVLAWIALAVALIGIIVFLIVRKHP